VVDVVVVLFDSDERLFRRCVDSVARAGARADVPVRLVLVDNGGRLPSLADLGVPHVLLGSGANVGFGRAVNGALEQSAAPWTLLLNPDAALHVDGLSAFLAAAERRPAALLAGSMVGDDGVPDPDDVIDWDFCTERFLKRLRRRRSGGRGVPSMSGRPHGGDVVVEKVTGGALFAATSVLRDLGPFDERFFLYCEDADLSRRAARSGVPLLRVAGCRVAHAGSASARSHALLVEVARADAAVRLTAYHRPLGISLLQRVELALATLVGAAVEKDAARRRARLGRLSVLRRWGLRRDLEPLRPAA